MYRQKKAASLGKTKRGKGTKLIALAGEKGRPDGICVASASPHQVMPIEATLQGRFVDPAPVRLIRDRDDHSDGLDERLAAQRIAMIAPNRRNRSKSQDGCALSRYGGRWKLERLFA